MGTNMRIIFGMVILLLFLQPHVSMEHCSGRIIPPELDRPASGSVHGPLFHTGFMSSIVHSFLSSVQPNPFPKDLFIKILNSRSFSDKETINEFLHYEVGFLVCLAIGILYIILMPVIGLCFACCRCCGNCGGYMYQEQTNNINCRRRSFYWATFIITVLILAGNICMFLSNTYTHENVNSAPGEFNNTLKNLQSYITTIPKQLDQVVNESLVVVDNVTHSIKEIGPFLGREIQTQVKGSINLALDSVMVMAQVIQNTSLLLYTVNTTQKKLDILQSNLTEVKTRINKTLHDPNCMQCLSVQSELDKLSLGRSINSLGLAVLAAAGRQRKTYHSTLTEAQNILETFSAVDLLSGLSKLQSAVDQAEKTDLNTQIQKGKDFFESIPERVTKATRDSVEKVQTDIQIIKDKVSKATTDIPLHQLTDFSNTLNTVQEDTNKYIPTIDKAEKLRWSIAVILCCLILLVVLCNLLGLVLGPAGLVPRGDPTDRSSTANCGGLFFMASVGFSFLFSWIFMIVVLILFLVGGNAYTLICVPWKTQQIFQLIDTPGVIPGFQLSQSLGLKTNLTISDVYHDCQMNKSLWNTLHLEDIINLNNYLNVSKYTGQVQEALKSSNITLPSIVLLDSETKKQLKSFSATGGSVNFSNILQEDMTSSMANLSYIADRLDGLAEVLANATVKTELQNEAKDLRFIQTQFNSTIKPQLMELKLQIKQFSHIMSQINATVENVLATVSFVQDVLNNNTTQTVKSKLVEFVDCQIRDFTMLADWANNTITEQVGRCGPVAVSVNTVENLFCSQLVDSLNAFWFSLGWCMIFLIPSIIFSVKLAKFYRRMKYKDEFLDDFMMNPFPRVNLKSN